MRAQEWMLGALLCGVACLGLACGAEPGQEGLPGAEVARAPVLGSADGGDTADRQCQVVLRQAGRLSEQGGFQVSQSGGWIWAVDVDVARNQLVRGGVEVGVLYRSTADNKQTWWKVTGEPVSGGEGEFQRYRVLLHEGLFGPGLSATGLQRSQLELVPYLDRSGLRSFDHNLHQGDFDNYLLGSDNQWSASQDGQVCPASLGIPGGTQEPQGPALPVGEATLRFQGDWSVEDEGALVPGGALTVHYDLSRLEGCRSTHNGYPAWDTRAFVKFQPSGLIQDQTVRRFVSVNGTPTNEVEPVPATFHLPEGTTGVELWFLHQTAAQGTLCQKWDSNQDRNYRVEVRQAPQWVGEAVVKISRAGGHPCEGEQQAMEQGFGYGTWARQRATTAHVCVQAWQPGVTDFDNPELWRQQDARLLYRFDGGDFQVQPLELVDRVGNNARYSFDVRKLDPLAFYRCPEAPLEESNGEVHARAEFYFAINGEVLGASDGGAFEAVYTDYAESPWREANCQ